MVLAPVAETYTMRACGRAFCSRTPARPCWLGAIAPRAPFPPAALDMACDSSKTITPSQACRACSPRSPASHSMICSSLEGLSPRPADRSVA